MIDVNEIALLEQYVQSRPVLSFSGLSKFLYSPVAFYRHYVLNQKEDVSGDFITKGKLLHCLYLEPEKFDEKFIVLPEKLPDDRNAEILRSLYKNLVAEGETIPDTLDDLAERLGSMMLAADYYATIKSDNDRGKKMVNPVNSAYWSFIQLAEKKDPVSQEVYDDVLKMVEIIRNDSVCTFLLNKSEREYAFTLSMPEFLFDIRGVVDNVLVNKMAKKVYISDVKTTAKRIQDFPGTVEHYSLWLQACLYSKYFIKKYPGYQIVFTFIVIDCYNVCYPYKVSSNTFNQWMVRTDEFLKEVNTAFLTKNFTLPSAYNDYGITL